jgi:hemerythrin
VPQSAAFRLGVRALPRWLAGRQPDSCPGPNIGRLCLFERGAKRLELGYGNERTTSRLWRDRECDVNSFLEWLDEWCLEIEEIDRQHLQLVALFNRMAEALKSAADAPPSDTVVLSLVQQLFEETRQHFKDEESIMREHDYPDLVDHHWEHVMLLEELQDFIREIRQGSRKFDYETLTSMKYWLIDHVVETDLAFVRYLEHE